MTFIKFNHFKVGHVDLLVFVALGLTLGWTVAGCISGGLFIFCLAFDWMKP